MFRSHSRCELAQAGSVKETTILRLVAPRRPMPQRSVGVAGRAATPGLRGVVPAILGLLLLAAGCAGHDPEGARPVVQGSVTATVETDPVPHDGDAADDPAIWVHPTDPGRSVILGTDKRGGSRCTTWPAGRSSTCRRLTSTTSTCAPASRWAAGA